MDKAKIIFLDENTGSSVTYELRYKSVGSEIAGDIIAAFGAITGHQTRRSRDQSWRSVERFCKYLSFMGLKGSDLDVDVVAGFGRFIEQVKPLNKANPAYYNFIKRLVEWLAEETQTPIWKNHGLEPIYFVRNKSQERANSMSALKLRQIVEACRREIAEAKKRFQLRGLVEKGDASLVETAVAAKISLLREIIELEKKGAWSRKQLIKAGCSIMAGDGVKELSSYRELTQNNCLPIFLLMMIQTAANPYALMEIDFDCLEINPLDAESAVLRWHKGRSNRLQNIATLKKGNYSVTSLVKLVKEMTQPIRVIASEADKRMLFITRTGSIARRLNGSGLHAHLADFRKRNELTFFTFSDIRRAVASIIFAQTGSIKEVSRVLQHKSMGTTEIYLNSDHIKQQRYSNLARFQGMMLALSDQDNEENGDYDTMLGFQCASPLTGSVGRSKKGEPCMEFLMCAGCRNAIVPVDDAQVIARIIRARNSLCKMEMASHQDQGLRTRYVNIFQPILEIIDRDILGSVSKTTKENAEKLALRLSDLPVMH